VGAPGGQAARLRCALEGASRGLQVGPAARARGRSVLLHGTHSRMRDGCSSFAHAQAASEGIAAAVRGAQPLLAEAAAALAEREVRRRPACPLQPGRARAAGCRNGSRRRGVQAHAARLEAQGARAATLAVAAATAHQTAERDAADLRDALGARPCGAGAQSPRVERRRVPGRSSAPGQCRCLGSLPRCTWPRLDPRRRGWRGAEAARAQLAAAEERALRAERQARRDGVRAGALAAAAGRLTARLAEREVRLRRAWRRRATPASAPCRVHIGACCAAAQEAWRACAAAADEQAGEAQRLRVAAREADEAAAAARAQRAAERAAADAAVREAAAAAEAARAQGAADGARAQAAAAEAASAAEAALARAAAEGDALRAAAAGADARAAELQARLARASAAGPAARCAELEGLVQRQTLRLAQLERELAARQAPADAPSIEAQVAPVLLGRAAAAARRSGLGSPEEPA